jgi:hypothetical protein
MIWPNFPRLRSCLNKRMKEKTINYIWALFGLAIALTGTILTIVYCDGTCHYSLSKGACTNYLTYESKVSSYGCDTGFYCNENWGSAFCWACWAVLPYGNTTCDLGATGYVEAEVLAKVKNNYPNGTIVTIYYTDSDSQCSDKAIAPPGGCIGGLLFLALTIIVVMPVALYHAYICLFYHKDKGPRYVDIELSTP